MDHHSASRLAVLIGAPGKNENYLRGVPVDLMNLQNFLLSPNGGMWYPDEIISLTHANSSNIASIIQRAYVDYLFVYFSGHGYTDKFFNRRMLCLQDHNIEDLSLLNRSPRQLIVADACRNYVAQGISGVPEFGEEPLHFDGESEARNLFDRSILQSPAGRIIVHGTQSGHYSSDSSSGGYFTRALLHVGTKINAEGNCTRASIKNVLHYVPSVLEQVGNSQRPEITYSTGDLKVPFAIGVPRPKYRSLPPQVVKEESNNNWGALGLTALLIAIGLSLGK
jgi:hypothetical protein